MTLFFRISIALSLLALLPFPASAHTTADMGSGFMAGLTHPLLGLDHLLAMLSVGIVSTQLIYRYAIWTLPATFVLVMIVGGAIGMSYGSADGIETGIAISVLLLGTSIFFGSRLPVALIYGCVGFFGFFHGYAHGAEMPEQAEAGMFMLGFICATITIHLAGVSVGLFSTHIHDGREYLRFAGGMIAGVGMHLLIAG